MKYMGSKQTMLNNGLSDLLADEIKNSHRFVDLFSGSGAVACHVGERFNVPVLAYDLQAYSAVLTDAIIGREREIEWIPIWKEWWDQAQHFYNKVISIPTNEDLTHEIVADYRLWSAKQKELPITKAYGGHYFSPTQAVWIDVLRTNLPKDRLVRTVALASLIQAASQCVAAPGHTAQPFQATPTAKKYLQDAWKRDIVLRTESIFSSLAKRHAKMIGKALVADANEAAKEMNEGDLIFIDPPYSGVHYSRFYHVLETIAHGDCGEVTGVGRYPSSEFRPRSKYSLKSESATALNDLFKTVATRHSKAIVTFPDHRCSNGLSGELVREIAATHFHIIEWLVESKFSTLGGTGDNRAARQHAKELMLVLEAR